MHHVEIEAADALALELEARRETVAELDQNGESDNEWFSRVIVCAGSRVGELVTKEEAAANRLSWGDYALCRQCNGVVFVAAIHEHAHVERVAHWLNTREENITILRAQVARLIEENEGIRAAYRDVEKRRYRLTAEFEPIREYVNTIRAGLHTLDES